MRVTIHQPTYLPYLGFFAKVSAADIFIIYDTAQYEKGSIHNRQRIRGSQGSFWLTIPLKSSLTSFRDTEISYGPNIKHSWYSAHWRSIEGSYSKTPFFSRYKDELFDLYHNDHPATLGEFNLRLIKFLLRESKLPQKVVLFSELGIDLSLSPSEKLAVA